MASDASRPPPEHFLTLIRQQQRGRLKIYLGFAAGVGKTYEMLQEAHRLKQQGVDVAIGIVETHGRPETAALVEGLEQVPRRKVEYRGVVLEELDLDAILQRRPNVCLVDELAHTNAPGSRHAKRYRDVEELLSAGINVISTLNVQHLESLYDMVEKFTGVKVKERIPDYVLGMADQLVNVDFSAEDLRERLTAGKVYPNERIQAALANFFTAANLSRLREQSGGPTPGGVDRVMVCLSSRRPSAEALLRKGARLADRLGCPWYAVYIQTPAESLDKVPAATQRRTANALALAHQLGGVPMTFKGEDVVSTIAAFAKEYGITHILLGRTLRPWYRRWFGLSLLDRMQEAVRGADLTVVDTG